MFDPNKPYRRRDGNPAKIVYALLHGRYIVVSENNNSLEYIYTIYNDGTFCGNGDENIRDLINIPGKVEGWVNVYPERIFATQETAKACATEHCLACIKVSFTEGEGLR